MTFTKLPRNAAWGVVRATVKLNQRNIVVFEETIDHAYNVPPFHHPLNPCRRETFQELSKVHLLVFKLAVMIMLWLILTRRDRGRMK